MLVEPMDNKDLKHHTWVTEGRDEEMAASESKAEFRVTQ